MNISKLDVGLFSIHKVDLEAGLNLIQSYSRSDTCRYIVTPNIDHAARLITLDAGEPLLQVYKDADLCLCDSKILEKMVFDEVYSFLSANNLLSNLLLSRRQKVVLTVVRQPVCFRVVPTCARHFMFVVFNFGLQFKF